MKSTLLMALAIVVFTTCPIVSAQPQNVVVISGATVIDSTGHDPIGDAVIVIEGNRIKQVGAKNRIKPSKNAQMIDARGKFVIPGLADMHQHLGNGYYLRGQGGPQDAQQNLAQMLAWGFTTIFSPGSSNFTSLKALANKDDSPMPRFFGTGRVITVKDGHGSAPVFHSYLPDTPGEARANVREMKMAGVDAIKFIYDDGARDGRKPVPMMKPEVMQAIIDEAHKLGLKAYAHATNLQQAKEVLRAGGDGLAHAVVSEPVDDEFIGLMKRNRAIYITTHSLFNGLADIAAWMQRLEALDERGVVPKEVYERFKNPEGVNSYYSIFGKFNEARLQYLKTNLRKVFDAGILVVAGTDTGVPGVLLGISSQMELVLLVEDGLKPAEALGTATLNAAKMLGREKYEGTVEEGKFADLLILDADPFADISNIRRIHRVIKAGVVYDPANLLRTTR
jgi:imidazolonepropionase-like amidohydrolase